MVTHGELRALGFSRSAIEHRLATGRLLRVTRGVYAVGWPLLTREGHWMAAVLACWPDAGLSHRSAAALWGFGEERAGVIDISVRRRSEHRRAGTQARSRPSLCVDDLVRHRAIPVTTPTRTLIDIATELVPLRLERAVNEADKLDLIDPETLRDSLDRYRGEPGVRPLSALLDRHTFRLSDSELEALFRPLAAGAGLPPPLTKQMVDGFEVDFHWPELDLVVETDGLRYHRTPAAQARDRLRDQTHTAAGRTALRFTHHQVKHERRHVLRVLRATARRLGQGAG